MLLSRVQWSASWDRRSDVLAIVSEFLKLESNKKGGSDLWRTKVAEILLDLQSIPDEQVRRIVVALARRSQAAFSGKTAMSWRPHWYIIAVVLGADVEWVAAGGAYTKTASQSALLQCIDAEAQWLVDAGLWTRHASATPQASAEPATVVIEDSPEPVADTAAPSGGSAPAAVDTAAPAAGSGQRPLPESPWLPRLQAKRRRRATTSPTSPTSPSASPGAQPIEDSDPFVKACTVLGCTLDMTVDDARVRYRQLLLQTHPDKGGNAADFHEVQSAWKLINSVSARM